MHMKYVDDPHVEATYGPDDRLPGNAHPYFLKSGEGQRVLLADQLFTFLMRGEEIARQAAIFHAQGPKGAACPTHVHADASVGIWVLDGRLLLTLDGEEHVLIPGDFAYAPPGCPWSYTMDSHFTQIHAIVTPAGFERLIARAGEPYPYYVFPTHVVSPPSLDVLSEAAQGLDIQFLR